MYLSYSLDQFPRFAVYSAVDIPVLLQELCQHCLILSEPHHFEQLPQARLILVKAIVFVAVVQVQPVIADKFF